MAKKKNYNLILYELQQEALRNSAITGNKISNELLEKQAKEEFTAPIRNINPANNYSTKLTSVDQNKIKKVNTKRTWFNSGAFDDGYQFGDITRTITGTVADVNQDITKGILKIGEGVIDTGAYLLGGGANLLGKDDFAQKMKDFTKKDLVEESKIANRMANAGWIGITNNILNGNKLSEIDLDSDVSFENTSLLGDKSDSLVQSAGQLGGTVALQAVGVPWFVTTGVTSFGGEVQNAFQNDATYGEAGFSGLVSAGAEVLTEKLSGGISFGGKTLDAGMKAALNNKITNKTINALAKFGLDVVGEGGEEVLTSVISRVGQKLSYEDEKTWEEMLASEEAFDEYLESFIGGAVLGGGANVGKAASSVKTGTNYDTGLTDVEETQADSLIQEVIKEQEANGKKLTNKQKEAVKNNVYNAIKKRRSQQNVETEQEDIPLPDNQAQVEGLQEAIVEKQEELNQAQDPKEKQIIQEELEVLSEELTEATNAQQITEKTEQNIDNNIQNNEIENITNKTKENIYKSANNDLIEMVSIDDINSIDRTGGGYRTAEQIEALRQGIKENGITEPIEVIKDENGKIKLNDGNHRLQIAKELGLKEVPVIAYTDGNFTKYTDVKNNVLQNKAENTNKQAENQEVMTEEEYLASKGYSSMGYSEAGLHKTSARVSQNTRNKQVEQVMKNAEEYDAKREDLRKEYQGKLDNGEIRQPTKIESLLKTAQGHEDNKSVQAARRTLEKRGIDWQTGNKIEDIQNTENKEVVANKNGLQMSVGDKVRTFNNSEYEVTEFFTTDDGVTRAKLKNDKGYETSIGINAIQENLSNPNNTIVAQVEEAISPLQETVEALTEKIDTLQKQIEDINIAPTSQEVVEQQGQEAFDNIDENNAPPSFEDLSDIIDVEGTTPEATVESPFDNRDIDEVGNRKIKAYQYENPEVRPYFQTEAENMMYDLDNTIKGEKIAIKDQAGYITDWAGTTRQTTEAIAYLKDNYGYSYDQIRKGLNDIIEDNGKENNAVAKRIEFMLDERLREGYTTSDGIPIPANEEYINFLSERNITEYNREISSTLTDSDIPMQETSLEENIAEQPIEQPSTTEQFELTDEQKARIQELKDNLKEWTNKHKGTYSDRQIKERAMQVSAEIRAITQGDWLIPLEGGLTESELANKIKRLKTNYIGKQVLADNRQGEIIGNSYGKIGVKFEDGTTGYFTKDQITPATNIDELIKTQKEMYKQYKGEQIIAPEPRGSILTPENIQNEQVAAPIENVTQNQNKELTDTSVESKEQVQERKEYEKHTGFKVEEQDGGEKLTKILTDMPDNVQESKIKEYFETAGIKIIDKGWTVKNEALRFKNQTLEEDYNQIKHANREAVNMAMDGYTEWNVDTSKSRRSGRLQSKKTAKSIESILEPIKKNNETANFYDYMYNQLNVDRMSLESRAQAKIQQMLDESPILKELNNRNTIANIENRLKESSEQIVFDEILNQEVFEKNNDLFKSKELRKEEAQRLRDNVWEIVKLKKAKNKVLLGTTAEQSQEHLKQYEGETDFENAQKDTYAYREKLQDILVDSGMLSEADKDYLNKLYPHYIPAYRNVGNQVINVNSFNNNITPTDAIGKATGGTQDILPLDHSLMVKTKQVMQSARVNKYLQNLKKTYEKNGILNVISSENSTAENTFEEGTSTERINKTDDGKYTATVYENGKKTTFEISRGQYEALKPSDIPVITTLNTFVDIKRSLLTQYNLYFATRNFLRDMPTAFLQSQNSLKWLSNIPEAVRQVATKGQYYQYAQSLGAGNNDYSDMNNIGYGDIAPINTNADHKGNKFSRGWEAIKDWKGVKWIATINNFIEQVPRMAEFITAVDSGKSGAGAIYAQDEVTVNFGKGGDVTKTLDRNVTNFVNANIQGGYKMANVFRDAYAYDGGAKGVAKVLTKYALAGGSMVALMGAMWDDDEDYEELSDYIKQNYYVIGKYGDGKFIKIPKGRTNAVIEQTFNSMISVAKGEKSVMEASSDLMATVENNLAPNSLVESSIFAGIYQTMTNTSWYGEDIVPTRLQKEEAKDQYDETTDAFSIWLGQQTGLSPYKINYLLDQSTGFLGDMILPLLTERAETPIDNPAAETFLGQFYKDYTTDSTMKNQNVTDIYSLIEEGSDLYVSANKTGAKDEDMLKYRYLNSVTASMNKLYAEKRTIQNETGLSNSEKISALRDVQRQIDDIAKEGLESYENITMKEAYSQVGNKEYYKNYKGEWKAIGEDEAQDLQSFNMTTDEKNTYFEAKQTISSIVNGYKEGKEGIAIEDEDSDEYKDAVSKLGSEKKESIVNEIINTGLNDSTKAYLYKKYYNSDTVDTIVDAGINVDDFLTYTTKEFEADYNEKGNAISGSRKNKVIEYVNSFSMNIPQKVIIIKSTNTFKFEDYNREVLNYVNGLDTDYSTKVKILKDVGIEVDDEGNVYW